MHFRVYNPDKPDKYGLKSYELCDADNGYCCIFELYTGASDEPTVYGRTYNVVMGLVGRYTGDGRTLYCDNYYSSPRLFYDLHLLIMNTGATGMARNHWGIPEKVKRSVLKNKGDKILMKNGPLMVLRIKDRKQVTMLSTAHSAEMVETGRINRHTKEAIEKPQCIIAYNRFMGAVDRSDQMLRYSAFCRRTQKWWKKVFFHLYGLAMLNAYILYKVWSKQEDKQVVAQRVFRREVVKQMIATCDHVGGSVRRGRPAAAALGRLTERHFLEKIAALGKKKYIARSCVVCTPACRQVLKRQGQAVKRPGHESAFQCAQCKVTL